MNPSEELEIARRVMVERLWFPRFIGSVDGKQRWCVYSWMALGNLRETNVVTTAYYARPDPIPDLVFQDPIEALVETDRWYKETVEPTLRTGGSTGS